jgi:hypothetical protein
MGTLLALAVLAVGFTSEQAVPLVILSTLAVVRLVL